ncbi:KCIP1 protein, partial [Polypterus senegalus]
MPLVGTLLVTHDQCSKLSRQPPCPLSPAMLKHLPSQLTRSASLPLSPSAAGSPLPPDAHISWPMMSAWPGLLGSRRPLEGDSQTVMSSGCFGHLLIGLQVTMGRPAAPDKPEDELEMTVVCHRPEGLEQLEAQTNFTKRELQILYRGFKNVNVSLSERHLIAISVPLWPLPSSIVHVCPPRSLAPHWLFLVFDLLAGVSQRTGQRGDLQADLCTVLSTWSTYAHYLFNAFDSGQNGSVKFEVSPPWLRHAAVLVTLHFKERRLSSVSPSCQR